MPAQPQARLWLGVLAFFTSFTGNLSGYRHIEVTARRTAQDYARQLQWLADVRYPNAKKIRLVQDNLNTHRLASLYLAFSPEEALRLSQRFEIHSTPVHGSWLNMTEIEIGIFERSCLRRRVESLWRKRFKLA